MKARISRGTGFKGSLLYGLDEGPKATGKKRPELISTNLPGSNAATFAAAFGAFKSLRPDIRRQVWHSSLRLPAGERLSSERWTEVVTAYLQKMGFDDATPYVVVRHSDVPDGDHVHVILSRVNSRSEVWLGQHEVHRAIAATQQLEREFGLTLTPGLGDADAEAKAVRPTRKADSQPVINANRAKGKRRIDTSENARVLLDCASRSRDLPSFALQAAAAGFALKPNRSQTTGYVSGLSVLVPGRKEFLKLVDATNKTLTWPKLLKIFEQNDQVAEAARMAARLVVDAADRRAAERVAARLGRQPGPVSQPPRALPPGAIVQAKEATMTDTTLDFLNPPPEPRPAAHPLDDAGLALVPTLTVTGSAAATDEAQARHKRKLKTEQEERERDQAMLDMQAEIRKLSVKELLDLRSAVPPFVMTAAAIQALINLMIRLLSLGFVKRVDNLSNALAARQRLQEYAEAELGRRRRSPATVSERKAALADYAQAVQERGKLLDDRHSLRTMPDGHAEERQARAAAGRRAQVRAEFDDKHAAAGAATIEQRQVEYNAAREAHRRARAENDLVPAGLTGLLIPKSQRDASTAAKAAAVLALKNAAERREATRHQLQLLLDEVESAAIEREQQAAEQAAAVKKAEARERDALARELRALPEQIREVGAAAQRVQHQERAAALVAEHNRPKTTAELEAVEAERLRQLKLANRRG